MQVESAIACNLGCVMCPWTEIRAKAAGRGIMSPQVWDAIRPHLEQVRSVDFTGGGEPLLQPRLAQWMADAASAGCETGILTNGLLLDRHKAQELLDVGMNWLCVSIDGATAEVYNRIRRGSDFDRVCENLAGVAELRDGVTPKIMINFVLMKMNYDQVEQIVELAARLGVDQVNFKQCDVIRGSHGKGLGLFEPEETKETRRLQKLLAKARSVAGRLNIKTTAFPFTPTEQPVCDQDPRDSVFIRFDGTAAPCINLAIGGPTTFLGKDVTMPQVHYGRLPDRDVLELWNLEPCTFYRERFQRRVEAYEQTFLKSLTQGSRPNRAALTAEAIRAMPRAPQGCRVCHYLYNV